MPAAPPTPIWCAPTDLDKLQRFLLSSNGGNRQAIQSAAQQRQSHDLYIRSLMGIDRNAA